MTDTIPNIEDRTLVNEALSRAVTNFTRSRLRQQLAAAGMDEKLADERSPVPPDYARFLLERMHALKAMVVEAEIAVATARLQERERCARMIETFVDPQLAIGPTWRAMLAKKIRNG